MRTRTAPCRTYGRTVSGTFMSLYSLGLIAWAPSSWPRYGRTVSGTFMTDRPGAEQLAKKVRFERRWRSELRAGGGRRAGVWTEVHAQLCLTQFSCLSGRKSTLTRRPDLDRVRPNSCPSHSTYIAPRRDDGDGHGLASAAAERALAHTLTTDERASARHHPTEDSTSEVGREAGHSPSRAVSHHASIDACYSSG